MTTAQHTQEKEALEDASNRLLVVNGVVLGSLAYTMVGTWVTGDGGVVGGPGYTVKFTPSKDCTAAIAAWLAAQQPAPPPPAQPAPTAGFTVVADGLSVAITDTSTNVASEVWDFGDGSTSASTGNQSHTYAQAGTYTITLGVTGTDGSVIGSAQPITVTAPPPPPTPSGAEPAIGAPVGTQAEWDAMKPKDA